VDWGNETHAVSLVDASGQLVEERTVAHTIDAVNAWLTWLLTRTQVPPSAIAVAIETPRGILVDTLLERGYAVFAINPKQLDRFRDRYTAAGAKDDRRDARVLGGALRTDRTAFRRVQLDDPLIQELRELARAEDEYGRDLGRFTNRVREQVARIAPALLTLCPAANEAWFWSLLEITATGTARPRVTRTDVQATLKRHRIRRLTADEVWQQLQRADFVAAAGVVAGVRARLAGLIEQSRLAHGQQQRCLREIDRVLAALASQEGPEGEPSEHRDVDILASLPGVGRLITATMLTDAARPLAERDYATLRAYAGTAPVTQRSGKRRLVTMRRACSRRLRWAAYHWGRVSITCDEASRRCYDALRQRGHSHGRALRSVVDRWFRILIAMLTHRTLYDPARFASPVGVVTT
jgi:transposase